MRPVLTVVALYDYEATGDDELSLIAGEQIMCTDNESSTDWWLGVNPRNGLQVYNERLELSFFLSLAHPLTYLTFFD